MTQRKKERINLSDQTIVEQNRNKTIVLGLSLINVLLAGAYFLEVLKGERSITQYLIVLILTLIPSITMITMYFKKKEAKLIRYVGMWSFMTFYTYVMMTTTKLMTFCYIILLIILLTPVFTPIVSSYIFRSLLWFISSLDSPLLFVIICFFVDTIRRKVSFFNASPAIIASSLAVV